MLDAASRLIEQADNIRLIVIGGGKLLSSYAQKYSKYKQIEFWGYQENPIQYLGNADLLVVPSLVDSFPNTIMEGLFLEIPVIGSRRGGIPEMLRYEALLFEPEADQLFHKIAFLLDNNTYEKYRELCLKRKEALRFDWGEAMKKLLQQNYIV